MKEKLPKRYGKYLLIERIARGGMAEIFKAQTIGAEGFKKDVAIKRILPSYTEDQEFVTMFKDEAMIASKLRHNNIVEIFDFDKAEDSYYLAMEYIEGKDLKKVHDKGLKEGMPLTVNQCVAIIVEVCKGLHYAHTKTYQGKPLNIVHRDISPQNIMISYNGEVKLMDFGIAKAASRSTKTQAGIVKGKVSYMSPEQARGLDLDGRSDLFSLAIVLWEILTHKRLFLAKTDFTTLNNIIKKNPEPPSKYNKDVPPELDRIVLKALEKDRDKRYRNVQEFMNELNRFLFSNLKNVEEINLATYMKKLFKDELIKQYEKAYTDSINVDDLSDNDSSEEPVVEEKKTMVLDESQFEEVDDNSPTIAMDSRSFDLSAKDKGEIDQDSETVLFDDSSDPEFLEFKEYAKKKLEEAADSSSSDLGEKRSKKFLFIGITVFILAIIAGILIQKFVIKKEFTGKTANIAAKKNITLEISVEPKDAKIFINDKQIKKEDLKNGKLDLTNSFKVGDLVTIKVEKEGYKPFAKKIKLEKSNFLNVSLPKIKDQATVEIVTIPESYVYINGEKKGYGSVEYTGELNSKILVEVKKEFYKKVKKVITLSKKRFSEVIKLEPDYTIKLKVKPGYATVLVDGKKVEVSDGIALINNLVKDKTYKITVKARGYRTKVLTIKPDSPLIEKEVKLEKIQYGYVTINARPFAEVFLDGKSLGLTPIIKQKVVAGHRTFILKKGSIKKTLKLYVKPNAITKSPVVNMK